MKPIDMQYDPYKGNYVITMEVSQEMAKKLEENPEAKKAFADTVQSTILAAFPSRDAFKEVMDPTKVETR